MTVQQPNGQTMTIPLRVRNSQDGPATLHLEPWGEQWPLAAGGSLDLEFEGPAGGYPEVECARGAISVYGWPGSTVKVVASEPAPSK